MNKFIKRIKDNQALYVLSILIIGILLLLIARITYAYLAPRIQSALGNVTTISDTVDDFKLELGRPLSLNATATTLPESGSNLVVTSTEIAKLKANSTKKTANYNYYLYLQITSNTFKYSDGTTPEIILTITDPNGNEITSLDNLTYGTYNGVSGFDVTTAKGLFAIANNYEITSNSSTTYTEHDWNITLTYLNLNIDQSGNYGNSFETKLYLQKETIKPKLAEYVISQYTGTQGENNIYYHDSNLANGANDNSYRYAGSNPDNYVCFGSDESTCPNDNLYRIIGVFGENNHGVTGKQLVKLIKYTSYGQYSWDNSSQLGSNVWETSSLNSILNYSFLTDDLKPYVTTVDWKVGGINSSGTSKEIYIKEITNSTKTVNEKVGLMYVSDYYYAVSPEYWEVDRYKYANKFVSEDWLFKKWQWTITPFTATEVDAFYIGADGIAGAADNYVSTEYDVYPTFYINSSINYSSGDGTKTNPIRIAD